MFAVIKYLNQYRNFSMEILNITTNIEQADSMALKYAEEKYGFDISHVIETTIDIKNIRCEYSLGDGVNRTVFAVMQIPDLEK